MEPARPVTQFQGRPGILDLSWGHPTPAALPVEGWAEATAAALRSSGADALTYGWPSGPGPLVDWLAGHLGDLERGEEAPSSFFVTAGASHALWLLCTVLAVPGDTVLVDAPTYHLALRILRDREVRVIEAPTDSEGLDCPALAGLMARLRRGGRRVAFLYLVPTFGNPTGRSLPDDRRRELVALAARTGLTVVEDDTYRELHYQDPVPTSLWRLAGGPPVVRVGSFSKTVAPGVRLGWIQAGPPLVRTLTELAYVHSGGCVNHTVAMTMAAFGTSGAYAAHVAEVRHRYRRHRDVLVAALREATPALPVTPPAGGWFLWLRLPSGVGARTLLPVAEDHGVSFVAGNQFYPDGSGGEEHIRVAFSFLGPEELAEAARRLGAALADARQLSTMA